MCFIFYIAKAPHPGAFSHSLPSTSTMSITMQSACSNHWINVLPFTLYHVEGRLKLLKFQHSTFIFEGIQSCAKNVVCGLSRISNRRRVAYLLLVTLLFDIGSDVGQIFQQRANIGITRSCMRWYVRKNYLTWVKTTEIPIWCVWNVFLWKCVRTTRDGHRSIGVLLPYTWNTHHAVCWLIVSARDFTFSMDVFTWCFILFLSVNPEK